MSRLPVVRVSISFSGGKLKVAIMPTWPVARFQSELPKERKKVVSIAVVCSVLHP